MYLHMNTLLSVSAYHFLVLGLLSRRSTQFASLTKKYEIGYHVRTEHCGSEILSCSTIILKAILTTPVQIRSLNM